MLPIEDILELLLLLGMFGMLALVGDPLLFGSGGGAPSSIGVMGAEFARAELDNKSSFASLTSYEETRRADRGVAGAVAFPSDERMTGDSKMDFLGEPGA
jgi:hypothetical protein